MSNWFDWFERYEMYFPLAGVYVGEESRDCHWRWMEVWTVMLPVAPHASSWGAVTDLSGKRRVNCGVDIVGPPQSAAFAVCDGEVVWANESALLLETVHGLLCYVNIHPILPSKNKVCAGTVLGYTDAETILDGQVYPCSILRIELYSKIPSTAEFPLGMHEGAIPPWCLDPTPLLKKVGDIAIADSLRKT